MCHRLHDLRAHPWPARQRKQASVYTWRGGQGRAAARGACGGMAGRLDTCMREVRGHGCGAGVTQVWGDVDTLVQGGGTIHGRYPHQPTRGRAQPCDYTDTYIRR